MKSPEGYEKYVIKEYLTKSNPIVWYFMTYMAGYGKVGVPDIVGCHQLKGFFSIEVKRPGKEPTAIQDRRMKEIEEAGGKTFWGTAEKVIAEFEAWIA
jgi:hypothetical protein